MQYVIGGAAAVVAVPFALTAAGFGAGSIAAGYFAAQAMSAAWTYGVGPGVIAGLQSAGTTGLGMGATAATAAAV